MLKSFAVRDTEIVVYISYQEAPCSPNKLQPFMDSRAALAKPMELAWTSGVPSLYTEPFSQVLKK